MVRQQIAQKREKPIIARGASQSSNTVKAMVLRYHEKRTVGPRTLEEQAVAAMEPEAALPPMPMEKRKSEEVTMTPDTIGDGTPHNSC